MKLKHTEVDRKGLAWDQGFETGYSDCITGWLAKFIKTATLEELEAFFRRVNPDDRPLDDFDGVLYGAVVPFSGVLAEYFRAGYHGSVWENINDRINLLRAKCRHPEWFDVKR